MTLFDYVIWYGSVFSPVVPLLFTWKRLNHFERIIVLSIGVSFFSDLLTTFVLTGYNYSFLHIYGLIEAIILLKFFHTTLKSQKLILILGIVFITLYLLDSFLLEWNSFNRIGRSFEAATFICLSLLLFYQFYKEEKIVFIENTSIFWFNIAILTYFSGAFFSFLLSNEILSGMIPSWILHNLSNILKNILFAIGLWKANTKQITS